MYYVGFSTCTIVASLIFFQGLNTTDGSNTISLLAGFIVTFLGVHLLNLSRKQEPPLHHGNGHSSLEGGLMNPRLSIQGRMSIDGWNDTRIGPAPTPRHGRRTSGYRNGGSNTLFNAFDEHENGNGVEAVGLRDLREDDEFDADERTSLHTGKHEQRTSPNPRHSGSRSHSHSPNPSRPPSSQGVRYS
jgi:magnesium transporter